MKAVAADHHRTSHVLDEDEDDDVKSGDTIPG
jgi:hypothetical protein